MAGKRLLSLDIFRGITIAFMIIVNTPGSWQYVYAPLRHSAWHGCTPTDLVFPAFLFIVGVSMWFSLKKYGHSLNSGSIAKIVYRTAVIFAIGLLLHLFPFVGKSLSTIRIMGVLQRIALAYGLAAVIVSTMSRRWIAITGGIILFVYWLLMYAAGSGDPYSLEGNFALRVDLAILGSSHLYQGFGIPFDPEGLLSTLPAVVTVLTGFLAGEFVGKGSPGGASVLKLLAFGAVMVTAGLLWGLVFPVNKPLWTSSYVLYTGGISTLILAFLYLVIDVLGISWWTGFFRVFGVNALFIYVMAGLWTKSMLLVKLPAGDSSITLYSWIYQKVCVPIAGNLNGSLLFALLQVTLMWALGLLLYRKKIFIKI